MIRLLNLSKVLHERLCLEKIWIFKCTKILIYIYMESYIFWSPWSPNLSLPSCVSSNGCYIFWINLLFLSFLFFLKTNCALVNRCCVRTLSGSCNCRRVFVGDVTDEVSCTYETFFFFIFWVFVLLNSGGNRFNTVINLCKVYNV